VRDRQLADVVQQQADAEQAQPAVDVVEADLAAAVLPAVAHQRATDEQPDRAHVDRVLVRVRVGRREVVEHEGGARVRDGAGGELVDDGVQPGQRAGGQPLAAAQRALGVALQRADGAGRVLADVLRDEVDRLDAVREVVVHPHRADPGVAQGEAVALAQRRVGPQEGHLLRVDGGDVAREAKPRGPGHRHESHDRLIGRSLQNLRPRMPLPGAVRSRRTSSRRSQAGHADAGLQPALGHLLEHQLKALRRARV
jgi:hypothetical protein